MSDSKVSGFVFEEDRKASLVERLKKLAERHKSLRAAAREWGLSFSTLNNYLNRGTEPSFFVMQNISIKESVSMDWLAYGSNDPFEFNKVIERLHDRTQNSPGIDTWCMIYDNLTNEDRKTLIGFCLKEGGRGMVRAVMQFEGLDNELLSLSPAEKERLIRLHEQLKKGSPEAGSSVAEADLSSDSKKAG